MKKDEIHLSDWQRILFGQEPPVFLIEVMVRTLLIYLVLLVVVRWLGKRMSGQLTVMEMVVMLTLGAIVSVAMQIPDRGILLSAAVLLCTLTFQRGLGWLGFKSHKVEKITQGRLDVLVKDGILQLREMEHCRISRQQLFAQLRSKKVTQLGMVKRVYLEASGLFSIYTIKKPLPGLSVLPPDDKAITEINTQLLFISCINCGYTKQKNADTSHCNDCGDTNWVNAME